MQPANAKQEGAGRAKQEKTGGVKKSNGESTRKSRPQASSTNSTTQSDGSSKPALPTATASTKAHNPPTVKLSLFDMDIAEPDTIPSTTTPPPPAAAATTSSIPTVTLSLSSLVDKSTNQDEETNSIKEVTSAVESLDIGNNTASSTIPEEEEEWESGWADQLASIKPSSSTTLSTTPPTSSKPRVRGRGGSRFADDSGALSHPDDTDDISNGTVADTSVSQPQNAQRNSSAATKEKEHVLEIYDIPPAYKTIDLEKLLEEYKDLVRFKWVNDTSAIAIFRTALFAREALVEVVHPIIKLRPLSEAPEEARHKAMVNAPMPGTNVQRPYKTTTTVARRLIANALQMPGLSAGRAPEDDARDARRRMWDE